MECPFGKIINLIPTSHCRKTEALHEKNKIVKALAKILENI